MNLASFNRLITPLLVSFILLIAGTFRAQASSIPEPPAVPASLIYTASWDLATVQTFSVNGKNVSPTLAGLSGVKKIAYGPSGDLYALGSSGGSDTGALAIGESVTTYNKYGREVRPTIVVSSPYVATDLRVGPQGLVYLASIDYQAGRTVITSYDPNGLPTKLSLIHSWQYLNPLIALNAQGDLYALNQSIYSAPTIQKYTATGAPIGGPIKINVCKSFTAANDIAIDNSGKVYIATNGCGIEEFTASGALTSPNIGVTATDIAVNSSGNIYTIDDPDGPSAGNQAIQKFNRFGTQISPDINLPYSGPEPYSGIALASNGYIHVGCNCATYDNGEAYIGAAIWSFSPTGVQAAPAVIDELHDPVGVTVDSAGQLFVENDTNGGLLNASSFISTFNIDGAFLGLTFGSLRPFTLTSNTMKMGPGEKLYVADSRIYGVYIFTTAGAPFKSFKLHSGVIRGLAVDVSGNIYVTTGGNELQKFSADGVRSSLTIPLLNQPAGVAVDSHGKIYIVNAGTNSVNTYTASGQPTTPVITGLNVPSDIEVDAVGNIFVSSVGARGPFEGAVSEYTSKGTFVRAITNLDTPYAIAIR